MALTSQLVGRRPNPDRDEIVTTAVSLVVFDAHYKAPAQCSRAALGCVSGNIGPKYRAKAEEKALGMTEMKRVKRLAKNVYDYIETVVAWDS